MENIITINQVAVNLSADQESIFAKTKDISAVFGKAHYNVIRDVDKLITLKPTLASELSSVEYIDSSGKSNKMYKLSRDLFNLIVLGFTGEKALDYKIAFIQAFNMMESNIKEQQLLLSTAREQALVDHHKETIAQVRAEKKQLNTYAGGMESVNKIRSEHSIPESSQFIWECLEYSGLSYDEVIPMTYRRLPESVPSYAGANIPGSKTPVYVPQIVLQAIDKYKTHLAEQELALSE